MFEEKLKEKYYEACAWIDCLNSMPSTEAKKQHALGYKAALEWAMEQWLAHTLATNVSLPNLNGKKRL